MKSTAVLVTEHAGVWNLVRCLEALVNEACEGGRLDGEAAIRLLSLFADFVDGTHQDKEEQHLFPRMLARATPAESKRLELLFDDHARERRRLIGMRLHLTGACAGRQPALDRFLAHARLYASLQRNHLIEEELYVLPLADTLLGTTDDRALVQEYRKIDVRLGSVRELEMKIANLCRRFSLQPQGSLKESACVNPPSLPERSVTTSA